MFSHLAIRFVATRLALLVMVLDAAPDRAQDFSRMATTVAAKLTTAQKKSVAITDFTDLQMT
jgi:hypothetical protein